MNDSLIRVEMMNPASLTRAERSRPEPPTSIRPGAGVSDSVLQFRDRTELDHLLYPPRLSPDVMAPMQQLVELVDQLRSPTHGWQATQPPTPEVLEPYTVEEVETVMQALTAFVQSPDPAIAPDPSLETDTHRPDSKAIAGVAIATETLIPILLWSIARTSYPIMQLLEGIQVSAYAASQATPTPGMLRLMVILQLATSHQSWRLDLATRQAPQSLLDPTLLLQVNDDLGVADCVEPDLGLETLSDEAPAWATLQLQTLTQEIQAANPRLKPWLDGMAIDCLVPEQGWLTGTLHLQFEFEFRPQPEAAHGGQQMSSPSPVEAELLDASLDAPSRSQSVCQEGDRPWFTQVSILEVAPQPVIATTIVRLSDQSTLEHLAQFAIQQEIEKSLHQILRAIQPDPIQPDPIQSDQIQSDPVQIAGVQPEVQAEMPQAHQPVGSAGGGLAILQEAYRIASLTYSSVSANWSLLQPELLMDELVPKLLWQVARSSYTLMSWIGGITASVLQPGADWMTGTLRLVLVLSLAPESEPQTEPWLVDLATGRFLPASGWQVAPGAIARLQSAIADVSVPNTGLIDRDELHRQLVQLLRTQAPEMDCLMAENPVEWLTIEHDWQPGTLRIFTDLEFIPNLL